MSLYSTLFRPPPPRPLRRLMEAAVWALARWADTYLFPDEELPGVLQGAFGGDAAVAVLDGVVQVGHGILAG
jgi:hypothetical protein